jgi:hydrogenase maturation factor
VPEQDAEAVVAALRAAGLPAAAVIGRVEERGPGKIAVSRRG